MSCFFNHLELRERTVCGVARALAGARSGPLLLWSNGVPENRPALASHSAGHYDVLFLDAQSIFRAERGRAYSESPGGATAACSEPVPFRALEQWLADERQEVPPDLAAELPGISVALLAGAVGAIAYDAMLGIERIRGMEYHDTEPEMIVFIPRHRIIFDRSTCRITVVSIGSEDAPALGQAHQALCDEIESMLDAPESPHCSAGAPQWTVGTPRAPFVRLVERAVEYIRAGDAFQIVLSNRLTAPYRPDPFSTYERLQRCNPSPYHFLLRWDCQSIVGASPEVMLRSRPREEPGSIEILMRPVAGTYPKGILPPSSASALRDDLKEQAEHLMLVDHARNDVGRVSQIGSVEVSDLFSVESYATIHHLVSQVQGVLRQGHSVVGALESCFPIATLTGTPKIRAMEIIASLEQRPRGFFGGAIVAVHPDGWLDSAVAIRFLRTGAQGCEVQAGAGIVIDSDPEREFRECLWKAHPVCAAAGLPLFGPEDSRPGTTPMHQTGMLNAMFNTDQGPGANR